MQFKHTIPNKFIKIVADMIEFANGGTQTSIILKNGEVFYGVLISNSKWIIAIRGYKKLPFKIGDIEEIYQIDDDKNPKKRGEWTYF